MLRKELLFLLALFFSEADEESEETGFVAEVLEELLRERRPRETAVAEVACKCLVLGSAEDLRGGATGIQEASEFTGLFIHDSGLLTALALLRLADSPRLALTVVSNWTSLLSKATQSLSPSYTIFLLLAWFLLFVVICV